jgi:hypothetical protein
MHRGPWRMRMQSQFLRRSLVLAMTLVSLNALLAQSPEEPPTSNLTVYAPQLSLPCGSSAGVRFNLEPRVDPLPQNGTAVDFLPGAGVSGADLIVGAANDMRLLTAGSGGAPDFRGIFGISSQTEFYVHRDGMDSDSYVPLIPRKLLILQYARCARSAGLKVCRYKIGYRLVSP